MSYVRQKVVFLNWFLFMLALVVACAYGVWFGGYKPLIAIDKWWMLRGNATIGLLTCLYIGFLSWRLRADNVEDIEWRTSWLTYAPGVLFSFGIVGSGVSIYLQTLAESAGTADLLIVGQGVLSTVVAAASVGIMYFLSWNLSYGIARIQYMQRLASRNFFGEAS